MKKIIYIFLLSLPFNLCQASILQCVGMESGVTVNLISDSDSGTLNINGNILKVVGVTRNGRGVTTEDYINRNGMVVYFSLSTDDYNNPVLIQFNGVNQEAEMYIALACH